MNPLSVPDTPAVFGLVLTTFALALLAWRRIKPELTALIVLVVLAVFLELSQGPVSGFSGGAVSVFSGFGHPGLIAVLAMMIAGHALVRTGALEPVGRMLSAVWRLHAGVAMLITMLVGATLSAFISNAPIVVMLLPILVGVSLRSGRSSTAMLMPVGLATIIGGMATVIGSSSNLMVLAVAADGGLEPLALFDFLLPAAVAATLAIVALWLLSRLVLPPRQPPLTDTKPRIFTAEIRLDEDSAALGHTLAWVMEKAGNTLKVTRIQRGRGLFIKPLPDVTLQDGDRLLVSDTADRLQHYRKTTGGVLYSGDDRVDEEHPLIAENQQIAEMAVMSGSRLEGQRLSDAQLAKHYKLRVLAAHRGGEVTSASSPELERRALRAGDVLLVQASARAIDVIKRKGTDLLVLDGKVDMPRTRKAPVAMAIMVAVVVCIALGWLSVPVSAMAGVMLLLGSGCLALRDLRSAISSQLVLVVVMSLALSQFLVSTGASDWLAGQLASALSELSAAMVLAVVMLGIVVLTNLVPNMAVAIIATPIAMALSRAMGLPTEALVLSVLFGANMGFATPMAYRTNLLVMNAGGYTAGDFLRLGLPLIAILWVALSLMLSWLYGLL
jgi:di/tricarboxylate transporter